MSKISDDEIAKIAEARKLSGFVRLASIEDDFAFMGKAAAAAVDLIDAFKLKGVNRIGDDGELSFDEFDSYVYRLFDFCTEGATISDKVKAVTLWQQAFDSLAESEGLLKPY